MMAVTSVRLSDDLSKRLDRVATEQDRSKGWIIAEALNDYLNREELRRQRLADTREALDDLEAGDVVAGEEVLAWLESWGKDEELPPPGIGRR
jgi:predicted transcriptional regulator